ncbi:MAG: hypothetical protein RMA76_19810 [Deltaproteobacteria bacterium]|jgi:hypothetical protein
MSGDRSDEGAPLEVTEETRALGADDDASSGFVDTSDLLPEPEPVVDPVVTAGQPWAETTPANAEEEQVLVERAPSAQWLDVDDVEVVSAPPKRDIPSIVPSTSFEDAPSLSASLELDDGFAETIARVPVVDADAGASAFDAQLGEALGEGVPADDLVIEPAPFDPSPPDPAPFDPTPDLDGSDSVGLVPTSDAEVWAEEVPEPLEAEWAVDASADASEDATSIFAAELSNWSPPVVQDDPAPEITPSFAPTPLSQLEVTPSFAPEPAEIEHIEEAEDADAYLGDGPFAAPVDAPPPTADRFARELQQHPPMASRHAPLGRLQRERSVGVDQSIRFERRAQQRRATPVPSSPAKAKVAAKVASKKVPRRYPKMLALLRDPDTVPMGNAAPEPEVQPPVPGTFFPAAKPPRPTPAPADLDGLLATMAEGLLIGETPEGETEVRVTLKDEFFAGTELRITLGAGKLKATLVPPDREIYWQLAGNVDALRDRLTGRGLSVTEITVADP